MSRIGKKPIIVPQNVTANIDGNKIEIKKELQLIIDKENKKVILKRYM